MKSIIILCGLCMLLFTGCCNDSYMDGWNDRIATSEWRYDNDCAILYEAIIDCPDLQLQLIHKGGITKDNTTEEMKRCTPLYTSVCEEHTNNFKEGK